MEVDINKILLRLTPPRLSPSQVLHCFLNYFSVIADVCKDQMNAIRSERLIAWICIYELNANSPLMSRCLLTVEIIILVPRCLLILTIKLLIPSAVPMSVVHPTDKVRSKLFMKLTDLNGVAMSKPKTGGRNIKLSFLR